MHAGVARNRQLCHASAAPTKTVKGARRGAGSEGGSRRWRVGWPRPGQRLVGLCASVTAVSTSHPPIWPAPGRWAAPGARALSRTRPGAQSCARERAARGINAALDVLTWWAKFCKIEEWPISGKYFCFPPPLPAAARAPGQPLQRIFPAARRQPATAVRQQSAPSACAKKFSAPGDPAGCAYSLPHASRATLPAAACSPHPGNPAGWPDRLAAPGGSSGA